MNLPAGKVISKEKSNEIRIGKTVIREYFKEVIPNIGLITTCIEGVLPAEPDYWIRNNEVDELYFVISGEGKLLFDDGSEYALEPNSAALIPKKSKFRVEGAKSLYIVVPTSPAWSEAQHELLKR